MPKAAIIFDVDGVLLELTRPEEDLFFEPFKKYNRPDLISYDWNSYRIRNEEDILQELVERHGLPSSMAIDFKAEYLQLVAQTKLSAHMIPAADTLLRECSTFATIGIATANFRDAARMRLDRANLWQHVQNHAYGADGGGAKHEILGRALTALNLPQSRIIFIGDNLNDVEAGLKHNVQFIAFSENKEKLATLSNSGAKHLSQNHDTTIKLIKELLA
jgi:beta-phosphoglucomutase-like phosphatase (HAD superfamily)